ncbi:hypothetical protein FACS189494_09570 [Spirochaetia bacterium]|nr:hypothetical protein FACS189494_09570 [Spirochaetia bacterium]
MTVGGTVKVSRVVDGITRYFETLSAAVSPSPTPTNSAGPVITIINDIELAATINVSGGDNFEITVPAGWQKTIRRANGFTGSFFNITGGSLTFAPVATGALIIDGGSGSGLTGNSLVGVSGGTFTMQTGTVLQNNNTSGNGGAVYISSSGTFAMAGGSISGNAAVSGGGVYVDSGTFTMQGGAQVAVNNEVYLKTGARIYVPAVLSASQTARIRHERGLFGTEILSGYGGYSLTPADVARFTMTDGRTLKHGVTSPFNIASIFQTEFYFAAAVGSPAGNDTSGNGAQTAPLISPKIIVDAIPASAPETFTFHITGEIIPATTDTNYLFSIDSGKKIILKGESTGASINAAGSKPIMNVSGNASITMENLTLKNGFSASMASGVEVDGAQFTMKSGAITGCNSNASGGVVSVSGTGSVFSQEGGVINNNTGLYGYGVYISGGKFEMKGGAITGNTVTAGAAVYSTGTFEVSGGAQIDGGVYLATGKSITLKGDLSYHTKDNPLSVTVENLPAAGGTRASAIITSPANTDLITNNIAKFKVPHSDTAGYYKLVKNSSAADINLPNTVYVKATGGSDSNNGLTPSTAKMTLEGALSIAPANGNSVTVIGPDPLTALNSGATETYSTFPISGKGTPTTPITIIGVDSATLQADTNKRVMYLNGSYIVLENIKLTGGSTDGGSDATSGGGIRLAGGSQLTLNSGAVITGNHITSTASGQTNGGGGIYVPNGCTLTMNNGAEISVNECAYDDSDTTIRKAGGGVQIQGGTFNMTGGIICGNKADLGGGVDIQSGNFNMSGGAIGGLGTGNTATKEGGGVHLNAGTVTMSGGSITYNTALNKDTSAGWIDGGGGVGQYQGTFNMSGGTIANNIANGTGTYSGGSQYFKQSGGTVYILSTTYGSGSSWHSDSALP